MEAPEVRYTKSGDVSIAYSVVGDGPFDVVFVGGWVLSSLDVAWEGSPEHFFRRSVHGGADPGRGDGGVPGGGSRLVGGLRGDRPGGARFLRGIWDRGEWDVIESDRVLATVLFTDIVGSTAKLAELGDRRWKEVLHEHHALVRRQLVRFSGRELDTAGDGFFASFDGPARAIRCACAITDAVRELGIEVRAGLHTGECELVDGKVGGIAVHIGARVAAEAAPGDVLVSSTVKDLVAGSGIRFGERGVVELKGVPGEWRLYSVEQPVAVG